MNHRSKHALQVGGLLVLVLLGTCVIRSREDPVTTRQVSVPPVFEQPAVASTSSTALPIASSRASSPAPPAPPIIDSITLEKEDVCEGEENLVTVKAHTPDGQDAFLHYQVGASSGSPAAVRSYLDDHQHPTAHRISVFGKNNVATSVAMPAFRVHECENAPLAVIERHLRPNTFAEFEFDVRVVNRASRSDGGAAPEFHARQFHWSFGDGTVEDRASSQVVHDFGQRPQSTLYGHYLVTAEIVGDDGRKLTARHSLELLNPAFEALAYKNLVVLFSDLNPRFPATDANGVVDQTVRLWHTRPDPIDITKITITTRYAEGAGRSPPEHPEVGSVLGSTQIPPGAGLSVRLRLDTRAEPDTLSRDYSLEGRTPAGQIVRGAFSVMRPPPRPTRENHDPVSDPILLAKIKMAREVLHREFVTDEDLFALQRAGQFKDLRVDTSVGPPAPPPAMRPPKR